MIPGKPHLHRNGEWWVATVYVHTLVSDMQWLRHSEIGYRGYAHEPSYVSPVRAMRDAAYAAAESAWQRCGQRIAYYPMPRPRLRGLLKEPPTYRRLADILNRHLADPGPKC